MSNDQLSMTNERPSATRRAHSERNAVQSRTARRSAQEADIVETTFYVRYAETDQMGIVHHSQYIVWMEEGRSDYMRQKGADYATFEKTGVAFAVTEVIVRYVAPAHYGERVTVRTWIDSLRSRALTFGYEIVNADSHQRLVTGSVKLILIDRQGRVVTIPNTLQAALQAGGM